MTRAYDPLKHVDPDRIAEMVLSLLPSESLTSHGSVVGTTGKGKSLVGRMLARFRLTVTGDDSQLANWAFRANRYCLSALNAGARANDRFHVVLGTEQLDGGLLIDVTAQMANAGAALQRLQARHPELHFELSQLGAPSGFV